MPTTTITLTSFQTALAEAADYVGARDYASARLCLARAGIILVGLPKDAADAQARVTYREDLTKAEAAIAAAEQAYPAATDRKAYVTSARVIQE